MKSYEDMVFTLAKEQSAELIDNSSAEHAAVLIKNMLSFASKSIDLFTGGLTKAVYERQDILDAGKLFISRGGLFRVLIQDNITDPVLSEHEFLKSLKHSSEYLQEDNLKVFRLSDELRTNVTAHFLVMDNKGFRFEPHKDGAHDAKAIACFNNSEMAVSLSGLFDELVSQSTRVQLT